MTRRNAAEAAGRARLIGRVALSTIVVVSVGSLLHFAWAWSGRSGLVAVFAATNESTWEHLKLAFWPALILAPLQRWRYGALPGWLLATAVRCLLPAVLIVALFYGYTALLGTNRLFLDISVFVVAVFVGEYVGHLVMRRQTGTTVRALSALALVLATAAFSTLSSAPPPFFLFEDPGMRDHGTVVAPESEADAERPGHPAGLPGTLGASSPSLHARGVPPGAARDGLSP